jgi:signal transduction histidine kinase
VSSDIVPEYSDVVVSFADCGTGIEDVEKDPISEPFYTTKGSETGMGLTICRSIIESHGGGLRASPNDPYGTVFRITLPSGDL